MNRQTLNQKLLTPQSVILCAISYLRVPDRIKAKRATARYTVIKMTKIKYKERILLTKYYLTKK